MHFILRRYQHTSIDPDDPPLDKLSLNNIRHPYKTIGCLFNDRSFYANIQVKRKPIGYKMDLKNLHSFSQHVMLIHVYFVYQINRNGKQCRRMQ